MQQISNPVISEPDYLSTRQPDRPVLFFHPARLMASAQDFLCGFPGLVTYAVKANANAEVLETLAMAGVRCFDVASPAEMLQVRQVKPDAVLHYHNPVRSRSEIRRALQFGIASWSVDTMSELEKLSAIPKGSEIAVRLRLPVKGAAYDFGEKFGADPDHAVALLKAAEAMGHEVSMTFHPGTQCADPQAWVRYIHACADVAQKAGIGLKRLNVGGGFAAHRHSERPDLNAIFTAIREAVETAFPTMRPELVCEPGRAMVADGFSLATRVKAVFDDGRVFLNDGIYGALSEWRDIGSMDRFCVIDQAGRVVGGPASDRIVFGPTCDSLDRLPGNLRLADAMQDEDFILFDGMGAYSAAIACRFNGYGDLLYVTVR
ncbi:MAG: type III PLP-dependent enzyme [Paracoccaceae bacterium]|jgi:ornithine decarboxylase|nr:type III PLP-dependent enzyme [Paracoccaceae bacterium]MDP7185729.1 type III PLP-dependent enzyme [Paracoccaceae bacterium]